MTLSDEKLLKFQFSIDGLQVRAESGYKPVSNHFQAQRMLAVSPGLCSVFGFGRKSAKLVCVTKQEKGTVLPEQMMLKLYKFLAMTDGGSSEKSILKNHFYHVYLL